MAVKNGSSGSIISFNRNVETGCSAHVLLEEAIIMRRTSPSVVQTQKLVMDVVAEAVISGGGRPLVLDRTSLTLRPNAQSKSPGVCVDVEQPESRSQCSSTATSIGRQLRRPVQRLSLGRWRTSYPLRHVRWLDQHQQQFVDNTVQVDDSGDELHDSQHRTIETAGRYMTEQCAQAPDGQLSHVELRHSCQTAGQQWSTVTDMTDSSQGRRTVVRSTDFQLRTRRDTMVTVRRSRGSRHTPAWSEMTPGGCTSTLSTRLAANVATRSSVPP